MVIQESSSPLKNKKAAIAHIHYLERQQRYLLSLSHQLSSYHCVPKTEKLFEQMERLKRVLNDLMQENDQLIFGINKSGKRSREYLGEYQSHSNKVIQLKHEILAYISKAKSHG